MCTSLAGSFSEVLFWTIYERIFLSFFLRFHHWFDYACQSLYPSAPSSYLLQPSMGITMSVWGEESPEAKPNFHSPFVADKHLQAFHHDGMKISLFVCLFSPHKCVTLEGDWERPLPSLFFYHTRARTHALTRTHIPKLVLLGVLMSWPDVLLYRDQS